MTQTVSKHKLTVSVLVTLALRQVPTIKGSGREGPAWEHALKDFQPFILLCLLEVSWLHSESPETIKQI